MLPIIIWNILFTSSLKLGRYFEGKAPNWILLVENITRIAVFLIPVFYVADSQNKDFKCGQIMYFTGITLYFISWIVMILVSEEKINILRTFFRNLVLFAPAYLPILIFIGIGLMIDTYYYILISFVFIVFHNLEYSFTLK